MCIHKDYFKFPAAVNGGLRLYKSNLECYMEGKEGITLNFSKYNALQMEGRLHTKLLTRLRIQRDYHKLLL